MKTKKLFIICCYFATIAPYGQGFSVKRYEKDKQVKQALLFSDGNYDLPVGWGIAGSKPNSYLMGIDKGAGQDGKNAATIKSVDAVIDGFGTLMQEIKPGKFLGKRVRLTGFIKTENVKSWTGFWLRVDQEGSDKSLSFDNMRERPIKGTTVWTKYDIVLDVPANASAISYGAMLVGKGQIWFDNLTLEIVDESIKKTGNFESKAQPTKLDEPTNLDFEK